MTDYLDLLFSLLAGLLLGVFFFTGLWWTVRQFDSSKYVALLFLFSMLFRTGIVILGFYLIMGDSWQRLVAGLLGFIIVRIIATRLMNKKEHTNSVQQKSDYAS